MLVSITSSRQVWFAGNRASLQRVRAGLLVAEDERPYLDVVMDSPYEQLAGRGNTVCHRCWPSSWTRHDAIARPVVDRAAEQQ